jgi:hypothetical protein
MLSSLLASVVVIEFQTTEAHSSLDLTKVKYNIYRQSREENEKVNVRTSPNNLIHCENKNNNSEIGGHDKNSEDCEMEGNTPVEGVL